MCLMLVTFNLDKRNVAVSVLPRKVRKYFKRKILLTFSRLAQACVSQAHMCPMLAIFNLDKRNVAASVLLA